WIEIFNPGETAVDMGGMYITDDSTRPTKFRIPQGEPGPIVPAGGFLLLWADDDWEEGVTHLEIKLSGDGEFLALYDNDGKSLIDSLKFGPQQPDVSYGRLSDGGAVWRFFNLPSPGSSNHKTGAQ
ncbi:MAG: lamin tail domain-containing protein, partial [Bacteroidales bacterium]